MIAVPLFASSSVIGVLCCFSREGDAFDDDAARLLLTLSSEAALALEKASLYQTTLEDKTKIETIINSITDGLMVIDRESRLILANPFISRLMDLQVDDYDKPLYDLIESSKCDMEFREVPHSEALQRVLSGGESLRNEMIFGGEQPIIFQVFWAPLKDIEGKVGERAILLHDITDFVELDRMKSDFHIHRFPRAEDAAHLDKGICPPSGCRKGGPGDGEAAALPGYRSEADRVTDRSHKRPARPVQDRGGNDRSEA